MQSKSAPRPVLGLRRKEWGWTNASEEEATNTQLGSHVRKTKTSIAKKGATIGERWRDHHCDHTWASNVKTCEHQPDGTIVEQLHGTNSLWYVGSNAPIGHDLELESPPTRYIHSWNNNGFDKAHFTFIVIIRSPQSIHPAFKLARSAVLWGYR